MRPSNPPAINLPYVVTVTMVVLIAIHVVRGFLPADAELWLIAAFAFIPGRVSGPETFLFPGGTAGDVWSFLTYAVLHADVTHLIVNGIWLLAFGGAVAKRFGALRFLALSAAAAVAGALAHLAAHWGELVPMVGASAAISGQMAAAIRFALSGPGLFFRDPENPDAHLMRPALPLSQVLRERQVIAFLAVWFAINFLFGVGTFNMPGQSGSVAWEAHVGGFLCGLLGFRLFDPLSGRARADGNHSGD